MPTAQRKSIYLSVHELDRYHQFCRTAPDAPKMMDDGGMAFRASGANVRAFRLLYDDPIQDLDGTLASVERYVQPIIKRTHLVEPQHLLYKHQLESIDTVLAREYYGFFDEQGTGKTAEIDSKPVSRLST